MRRLFLASGLLICLAAPAVAQKSQDTLRVAITDPFSSVSAYYDGLNEAGPFFRRVYEPLISYDERQQKIVGILAKSWTRVNPTTLEFELRDDRIFHNGDKFDADDVVSTVNFTKDPQYQFRFKSRFTWVKEVEKLGPYKVRITSTEPLAIDLGLLAYRTFIQDKKAFDGLTNKADYGRLTPYGTGSYKVLSVDRNAGIMTERYEQFNGDKKLFSAPIKKIHAVPMPDVQTQSAQLLTGGIDVMTNVPSATADSLGSNPGLAVSNMPSASFQFFGFDAAGRSGNKPLQDVRVRRAMFMGIDRDALIKFIMPGAGTAQKMDSLCFTTSIGCRVSVKPPAYDPEAAKKLLAEAGYANGFEVSVSCFTLQKYVCEAIAGYLLKIGVKMSVDATTLPIYLERQTKGEMQTFTNFFPLATHNDTGNSLDIFFTNPRDYANDPIMTAAREEGARELDPEKRAQIYERALNRNNEQLYVMGLTSVPMVFAHTKDVEISPDPLTPGDYYINNYRWK